MLSTAVDSKARKIHYKILPLMEANFIEAIARALQIRDEGNGSFRRKFKIAACARNRTDAEEIERNFKRFRKMKSKVITRIWHGMKKPNTPTNIWNI